MYYIMCILYYTYRAESNPVPSVFACTSERRLYAGYRFIKLLYTLIFEDNSSVPNLFYALGR